MTPAVSRRLRERGITVLIAALLYFVYWTVFTNAGAGR